MPLPEGIDRDKDGCLPGQEPQGDHDRDGLIGINDPDSDNDGVIDGEEAEGDCDRDGLPNIVDPDSDNDGVLDGQDSTPCGKPIPRVVLRRLRFSFHVGSTLPLGDLNRIADSNIYVAGDFTFRLRETLNLQGTLGLAQFTAETPLGIEHPRWLHGSANLQAWFPTPSGLRLYLRAGPGFYNPKSGPTEFGFNLGGGAQIPINGPFDLEFGADYHQIQTDRATRFITFQLGVLFH